MIPVELKVQLEELRKQCKAADVNLVANMTSYEPDFDSSTAVSIQKDFYHGLLDSLREVLVGQPLPEGKDRALLQLLRAAVVLWHNDNRSDKLVHDQETDQY